MPLAVLLVGAASGACAPETSCAYASKCVGPHTLRTCHIGPWQVIGTRTTDFKCSEFAPLCVEESGRAACVRRPKKACEPDMRARCDGNLRVFCVLGDDGQGLESAELCRHWSPERQAYVEDACTAEADAEASCPSGSSWYTE